jgi:beta-lactamase regulating signal transducer with metallopeptidase domain
MIVLLNAAMKAFAILALALAVLPLLRRQSAALRHTVLSAAMLCAGAMPILSLAVPSWDVTVWQEQSRRPEPAITTAAPAFGGENAVVVQVFRPAVTGGPEGPHYDSSASDSALATPSARTLTGAGYAYLQRSVAAIWAAGTLAGLTILIVGAARLAAIASVSERVSEREWVRLAGEIGRAYELRRPLRLLRSRRASLLATWRALRPEVLLPAGSDAWSEDRVHVVLAHELAHVSRGDWLLQMAAEVTRAIYWFNPLAWIACSRLRQESEQACDDAVLQRGVAGAEYAQHLLDLARDLNQKRVGLPALPMAREHTLERRFKALLNPGVNRRAATRFSVAAAALVALAVTLPIAAFHAIAETTGSAATAEAAQRTAGSVAIPIAQSDALALFQQPTVSLNPGSPSASIEGVVVKLGTGEPVSGVTVALNQAQFVPGGLVNQALTGGPNPYQADIVTTASDGRFRLQDVPPGSYRLVATLEGSAYLPAEYGQRHPGKPGGNLTLAAGQVVTDVRLSLAPTGSIAGRIVDGDGEPVGRARVVALAVINADGNRTISLEQAVYTNDLGEYRLFWLPPGEYYVAVKPEDPLRRSGSPVIRPPATRTATYSESALSPDITRRTLKNGDVAEEVSLYVYNTGGTETPWRTPPIELAAGAFVTGVDISAAAGRVRVRHVRGTVTGSGGARAQVTLRSLDPGFGAVNPGATADANGNFDIAGVVPGTYNLVARGSSTGSAAVGDALAMNVDIRNGVARVTEFTWAGGAETADTGIVGIDVGDADLANVTVSLERPFSLSGRVVFEGRPSGDEAAMARVRVSVNPIPSVFQQNIAASAGLLRMISPSVSGAFTVQGLAPNNWDYRVSVSAGMAGDGLPESTYVKSIRYESVDVLDAGGMVRLSGRPKSELEIVIAQDGVTLEGRALDERKQPSANSSVLLVPEGQRAGRSDLYKRTATDDAGRFRFAGVPPGDYRVYAWDDGEGIAWRDREALRPYEARGRAVRLGTGAPAPVEVGVIPVGAR